MFHVKTQKCMIKHFPLREIKHFLHSLKIGQFEYFILFWKKLAFIKWKYSHESIWWYSIKFGDEAVVLAVSSTHMDERKMYIDGGKDFCFNPLEQELLRTKVSRVCISIS